MYDIEPCLLSECCGGAAGVLADEGGPRDEPQKRGPGHLRVCPRLGPALHLLRHSARRILLRQLRGNNQIPVTGNTLNYCIALIDSFNVWEEVEGFAHIMKG